MAEKIWMKRVLIPLWVLQLIVAVILLGASAVALWVAVDAQGDENLAAALNIAAAISMSFAIFTIIVDIVEVILAAVHRLKPVTFVVLQSIKTTIWTVYFGLTIASAVEGGTSGLAIFLVLVLFLTSIGQLIYGSVILHRQRKGTLHKGSYALAESGGAQPYNSQQPYTSYNAPSGAASFAPAPPPYKQDGSAGDYYHGNGVYEMHGNSARY